MTVMTTMLRRHGATMIERHGRLVAAHFGSPVSEAAVCRSSVGLADRSDRATLAVSGLAAAVDRALAELGRSGHAVRWARRSARQALVRCDGEDADRCTSMLLRAEDVSVEEVTGEFAALELIGPGAHEMWRVHSERATETVVIVEQEADCLELLVDRGHGPALFNGLLDTGDPYGIALVGLEALEHIDVSERLDRRREHG